jgi:hypothetical protein
LELTHDNKPLEVVERKRFLHEGSNWYATDWFATKLIICAANSAWCRQAGFMISTSSTKHVVAVAGRRIDPDPAEARRFPFEEIPRVERELHRLFEEIGASILVTSAACGADLLALKVAEEMSIPARIILPFSTARFKETSVLDRPRPEYWGELFDNAIAAARAKGDVIELAGNPGSDGAYSAANEAIIKDARSLASSEASGTDKRPIAVIIWEGKARAGSDATDEFRQSAEAARLDVRTIATI